MIGASPLTKDNNAAECIHDASLTQSGVSKSRKCCFPVQVYPSQTKILEGGTKDEMRISKEALFKGVSTQFGPCSIEKSVENLDFIFCSSFQNLRLGSIKFPRQKVALSALGKRRVKIVDKDIDKNNKQ